MMKYLSALKSLKSNSRQLKRRLKKTILHPRYLSNKAIVHGLTQAAPYAKGIMLDIGCGYKPYVKLFAPYVDKHIGADIPVSLHGIEAIDLASSALNLPFQNGVFDTVLATEVMEHVPEPKQMLSEISRVLKSDGILILSVPFHEPLHELPYDFFRYTNISLNYLMKEQGLEVIREERRGGIMLIIGHLLCSYLHRNFGNVGYPNETRIRPFIGPISISICIVLQLIFGFLDKIFNDDFDTLGFVIVARKTVVDTSNIQPIQTEDSVEDVSELQVAL
jgi:SAM-dependent methyltransferase